MNPENIENAEDLRTFLEEATAKKPKLRKTRMYRVTMEELSTYPQTITDRIKGIRKGVKREIKEKMTEWTGGLVRIMEDQTVVRTDIPRGDTATPSAPTLAQYEGSEPMDDDDDDNDFRDGFRRHDGEDRQSA